MTATFAGPLPNTQCVTGARCYLGVAGAFLTPDANGAGTATFDLSGRRGRTIQLAPMGEGFFGANYALTAPLTSSRAENRPVSRPSGRPVAEEQGAPRSTVDPGQPWFSRQRR